MRITNYTSHGKILNAMQSNPNKDWKVRDFLSGTYFVGYEAGTRIGDLVREGYVESKKNNGSKFSSYYLTQKGKDFKIESVAEDVSYIFEQETTWQQIKRFLSF